MNAVRNQSQIDRVSDNVEEECQTKFLNFLRSFKDDEGEIKYKKLAERMQNLKKNSLPISFNDIMSYNEWLSELVMIQFFKLFPYLCKTTQSFINDCMEDTRGSGREYRCHFIDFPNLTSLRDLKTAYLGKLVKFRAQVIRSHPVHPELVSIVFKCEDCGTIIKSIDQEFIYKQPSICANPKCKNRKTFELMIEESNFVDFQKVRVQETEGELPRGSVPRSMDIILRSHIVEMAQPGDHSEFIGTLIVIPDVSQMAVPGSKTVESKPVRQTEAFSSAGITGLKSLGLRELTYKLAFLATNVSAVNNKYMVVDDLKDGEELTYESLKQKMTNEEMEKIYTMSNDNELVANLSDSLFPTIYGCDEVKRGILLMLFGGVPKVTEEGTRLRGDTNICIVGDPSTAKSQFLKRIKQFAPRAVYTSGKASSAAGLTAAVVKDQEIFEYVIEAGALMLANNGICCIDKFDKMDVRDQVAIHEAMEQPRMSNIEEKTIAFPRECIKNNTFVNLVKKVKVEDDENKKKIEVISGEKSKLSLADEFYNMYNKDNEVLKARDDGYDEIRKSMREIFNDLDTLFHTSYIPIKPPTDVKVLYNSNVSSIDEIGVSDISRNYTVAPTNSKTKTNISHMKRSKADRQRHKKVIGSQIEKKKPKTE